MLVSLEVFSLSSFLQETCFETYDVSFFPEKAGTTTSFILSELKKFGSFGYMSDILKMSLFPW
jgi:hypothetical protein